MMLFFDTSALVKLFNNEEGSETVKQLVTNLSNNIFVLELALIELQSAIYRKFRNNEIPEENLEKIQHAIESQFDYFNTVPMGVRYNAGSPEPYKKIWKNPWFENT